MEPTSAGPRIVGLNLSHDGSACVVENGVVRRALALERTTGIKRGVVPLHAYAAGMARLTSDLLRDLHRASAEVDFWIATSTETRDASEEALLLDLLGFLAPDERRLVLPHPGHHLAHASAAFYSSGFEAATAVVADSYGSLMGERRERESAFHFQIGDPPFLLFREVRDDGRIAGHLRDGQMWIPPQVSGIGEMYRLLTLALGFSEPGTTYDDAGKTMGLAAYGHRLAEHPLFIDIDDGGLSFGAAVESLLHLGLAAPISEGFALVPRSAGEPISQRHMDIAAQIQWEFEEACLHLVQRALQQGSSRNLVLSGGCFLNSVANARIAREVEIDGLFVYPAATDDGNAVGAALYAHHVLTGGRTSSAPPAAGLGHVFLGPRRLDESAVIREERRWGLAGMAHPGLTAAAEAAAAAIARGEIVGWFQDRSEFGPRALGARSILCHPGVPGMKNRLNARVKFREGFRPFAASVLQAAIHQWFDLPVEQSPFMLVVADVRPEYRSRITEVVHVDGTCRVQSVPDGLPGPYRDLIGAFNSLTGLPMVLNTSFNLRGHPMVERVEDAFDCLFGARLDRLFLGRREYAGIDHRKLTPGRQLTLSGGWRDQVSSVLEPRERLLLAQCDGADELNAVAASLGWDDDLTVDLALDLRRKGLLVWAGKPSRIGTPYLSAQYAPHQLYAPLAPDGHS